MPAARRYRTRRVPWWEGSVFWACMLALGWGVLVLSLFAAGYIGHLGWRMLELGWGAA